MTCITRREAIKAGTALAGGVVAGLPVLAKAGTLPASDTKLIELGERLRAIIADINTGSHGETEVATMLDRAQDIEDEIIKTPATTMAGMAVKLRIATDNLGPNPANDGKAALSALADAEIFIKTA